MKNKNVSKNLLILGIIVICVYGILTYKNSKKFNGDTIESREVILNQNLSKNKEEKWSISTEL